MKITLQQLRRSIPQVNSTRGTEFVDTFNEWADKFGIDTPMRVSHFLSQVAHESGNFNYTEENLNYSADGLLKTFPKYFKTRAEATAYAHQPQKIANRVYANRMGNGNEASGDGWKYKGRGMIGITGRDNYRAYQTSGFCVGDLVNHPEWLAQKPGHTKSAMWFWWKHGLSAIADTDNGINSSEVCKAITRKINGGYNGLSNRQFLMRRFKKEFGV